MFIFRQDPETVHRLCGRRCDEAVEVDELLPTSAKKKLDELLGIRGDIVHRSKEPDDGGPSKAHPVKREDLAKAIRFLKGLVDATEKAFA